jgi:alkylation response protein AidB-like acyl-CoA dehydrogenase
MLHDVARDIAAALAPASIDAVGRDDGWATLVESGLVGLHVPEALGGSGARIVDAALVAEQLAGALVAAPFVGAGVWAPSLVALGGAHEQLAALLAGERRLVPVLRADLRALATPGEEGVAFDAGGADHGLVVDADGRLHSVELGDLTDSVDLTRTLRRVPAGAATTELGGVLDAQQRTRAHASALAVLAADLVGVAEGALDDAVAYVKERVQFGVPVGSFQAVQHLAAHAKVLVEGARSSMWHAAWAADELDADASLRAARQAKAFCSAAARDVGEIAIQMFGGIGLTWEHFAHVRQRRILLSRCVLGDESVQYAAIADERLAGAGRR